MTVVVLTKYVMTIYATIMRGYYKTLKTDIFINHEFRKLKSSIYWLVLILVTVRETGKKKHYLNSKFFFRNNEAKNCFDVFGLSLFKVLRWSNVDVWKIFQKNDFCQILDQQNLQECLKSSQKLDRMCIYLSGKHLLLQKHRCTRGGGEWGRGGTACTPPPPPPPPPPPARARAGAGGHLMYPL
jgi:hypothetical protein